MILILLMGITFGFIIQHAKLNKYDTISGSALLENFTVAKTIALSIGIGLILLAIEISFGLAHYHIKPFIVGGIILGGLLFGSGMALLGYCPGTMLISLGEGSIDALIGLIGGIIGGLVFTLILPLISPILGPNLGALSLHSLISNPPLFYLSVLLLGALFIAVAFKLNATDSSQGKAWIVSGVALTLLSLFVFSDALTGRPIGASTAFPYIAGNIAGITNNSYLQKIATPGHWELIFLAGAFVAGIIGSLAKGEFKLVLIHENWSKHKGNAVAPRIIWAFIGGFILIMGARMAGGCTSGHILSGGMQGAISSLVFMPFVGIGFIGTAKVFFRKK